MTANKLCFIGFFPDYETYFFQGLQIEGMDVEVFNPLNITNSVFGFKKLPRFLRNIWHKKIISDYIKKQPNASFVFNEHRLLLQGICQYIQSAEQDFNGYLLLRNPVSDNPKIQPHIELLKQHAINILTFDKGDSNQYGFKSYPQFASVLSELKDVQITHDFSFIGRDKGRRQVLDGIEEQLISMGFQPYFDIRQPTDINLTYLQYLEQSLRAKCMVEILQSGQSGMTLRAIEALLYGRKLLTTNTAIVDEPFYHSNNIMVFDGRYLDMEELTNFMQAPLCTIDEDIKKQYLTETVVENFLVK